MTLRKDILLQIRAFQKRQGKAISDSDPEENPLKQRNRNNRSSLDSFINLDSSNGKFHLTGRNSQGGGGRISFSKASGVSGVSNTISGSSSSVYTLAEQVFLPTDIAGCVEWCITDDENLVVGNSAIQELKNLVPGGIHFTQSTISRRPSTTTINDKTWLSFDDTASQYLRTVSAVDLSNTDKVTLIMAFQRTTGADNGDVGFDRNAFTNPGFEFTIEQGPPAGTIRALIVGNIGTAGGAILGGAGGLADDTTGIITILYDFSQIGGAEVDTYLDNVNNYTELLTNNNTNANFGSTASHTIASRNGASFFAKMKYRGHVLYDNILSEADRTSVYNYFASRV